MSVTNVPRTEQSRESTGGAKRYHAIDGLRGVCALALLFTHVAMVQGLIGTKELGSKLAPSNLLGGFFASGLQIAAGVFFVITGLFIYRPFAKAIITGQPRTDRGNWLRRALRLLPAYYALWIVSLLVLNFRSIHSAWFVVRPFLLLHIYNWGGWMNGMEITWTVPDMAQFYLALPVLAWATHRYAARGATPKARAYRLLVPVPFLFAIGLFWLFFVKETNMGTRALFWWPLGLLPEIGIGMALASMIVLSKVSPKDTPGLFRVAAKHPNWFLFGALSCIIINCARPFSEIGMDDIYTIEGLVTFYVLLAALGLFLMVPLVAPGADSRTIRGVFTNKPILYLGKVSYGIYLWQFAVMHFYLQPGNLFAGTPKPIIMLRGEVGFWELEIATLVGSVILATISYYLLEQPIMAWGDRYLKRRELRREPSTPTELQPETVPA